MHTVLMLCVLSPLPCRARLSDHILEREHPLVPSGVIWRKFFEWCFVMPRSSLSCLIWKEYNVLLARLDYPGLVDNVLHLTGWTTRQHNYTQTKRRSRHSIRRLSTEHVILFGSCFFDFRSFRSLLRSATSRQINVVKYENIVSSLTSWQYGWNLVHCMKLSACAFH